MSWNRTFRSSKQSGKQRLYVYNAPLHVRTSLLCAHVAKDLREKHGRSVRVRAGDTVKIMRGSFKGKSGKVDRVDVKNMKIFIEGVGFDKRDGSKALVPVSPSNVLVTQLKGKDRRQGEKK